MCFTPLDFPVMSRQLTLATLIRESRTLCVRYFAGFDDSNRTFQPAAGGLPNHFAWCLGHMAYTMHRAGEKLDGRALPESDFIDGGTPSGGGDAQRFASKSVTMGSTPVNDPAQYPTAARCVEIFSSACERCAAAFEHATDEALDRETPWGNVTIKTWQLAPRMAFHNGFHTGQIADLRRALGLRSIFA